MTGSNGTSYDAIDINIVAIQEDENVILKDQFQEEYNAMVESVKKYGGFYIGRYETSWNGDKVASVAGATPTATEGKNIIMTAATPLESTWRTSNSSNANKATWYGLYAKQKELYSKNSSSSVVSGMTYGCQWDAIMNWMLKGTEAEKTFVTNNKGMGNYTSYAKNTGNYAVKNIYDLAGNYFEWTQEAHHTSSRVGRGGYYHGLGSDYPASGRGSYNPASAYDDISSRLQLYIK